MLRNVILVIAAIFAFTLNAEAGEGYLIVYGGRNHAPSYPVAIVDVSSVTSERIVCDNGTGVRYKARFYYCGHMGDPMVVLMDDYFPRDGEEFGTIMAYPCRHSESLLWCYELKDVTYSSFLTSLYCGLKDFAKEKNYE